MTIKTDEIILNKDRNVQLVTMLQNVGGEFGQIAKRPAILILPGGGYSMCSDREAEVVAYPYLHAGFHAFVLRYSVGNQRTWPNPIDDYDQAMELIRCKAEEWNVFRDKIAVIGFSAGGHLAACAATLAKNRPNAAILGYAALEQDIASACQPGTNIPAPGDYVDHKTCPCFLFAARDDAVVPIRNTVNFQSKLIEKGIMFESHIYAYGGHGFSTAEHSIVNGEVCDRTPNWVRDSISWLTDMFGQLTVEGMGKPSCAGKINGDWEEYLSVDCTIAHLEKQGEVAKQLTAGIFAVLNSILSEKAGKTVLVSAVLGAMKLRSVMKMIGQPDTVIEQLDVALRMIPNEK